MKLFSRKSKTEVEGPQVVLLIEGMHCNSCGLLIDDELEEVPGVRSAGTDVHAGRTVVRLDSDDVDHDALIAAVERAGYQGRIEMIFTPSTSA